MTLSWLAIVRLGLAQAAIGSVVALTTATLNRIMVVELALPALLPAVLVGLYYGVQVTRPAWGLRSDAGGRRSRWIVGGVAALGLGANAAAIGILLFGHGFWAALVVSLAAYTLIGLGVSAAGTSLLALLATGTAPGRRAAAASVTWLMMIAGIALTSVAVGAVLDPYSPGRLLWIVAVATAAALVVAALACLGVERGIAAERAPERVVLIDALRDVWREPPARGFTLFVFLSMTAYFMQELNLEPYAGIVFGLSPGQTTALSGAQHGGALVGMITVGVAATLLGVGSLGVWVSAACLGSAGALVLLAALGPGGEVRTLVGVVAALGFATGAFTVAAVGSMMRLAGEGRQRREGARMGLWGAAQSVAAGLGGLTGAALADLLRGPLGDASGFGAVFLIEAALFVAAGGVALRVMGAPAVPQRLQPGE